ncbi:nudC domain-containing protein 2-like isoform X1 [Cucurbita pepo subsp. pepo]|uniref:nudC domain-containing protein 2-like isoform X1 n=1 Tax=Cucurbita pepo subsp. pepo TaxID=3664 RepID=UPI000C9D2D99|nr:nudC domain-containing protein 2-like isoform X1 [Cucurbita pepo subsp. pepo]
MAEKLAPEKRHSFLHNGQEVFEWDQTLEEVNIYINLPPNVHSKQFYCKIQSRHVELGIKGNPPYLDHELTCPVKTDSSFWTLEDGIMHITLQKRDKGQTWASPIQGQGQLDPYSTDLEQKRLMLQRFQEEFLCRTLDLTSHKLSFRATVPIQGPSWVEFTQINNYSLWHL